MICRWIQVYATELETRIRPHTQASNGSWRVDETYERVRGRWRYKYRAIDSRGQTIDFLLSAKRDVAAVKRFFRCLRCYLRTMRGYVRRAKLLAGSPVKLLGL